MTTAAKEWYDMAVTDLQVAKHLNKTYYPKPLEIICYHCQQAAEKAIKSLFLSCDMQGGMPKSHDLSFLLKQIKSKVKINERYYEYADTLTPYGVTVRYPSELFLEDSNAEDALMYADEILQWVMEVEKETDREENETK